MTAVAGSVFTAAQFNQYVRDNLLQTAPAVASAAGQLIVSTAVNAITARSLGQGLVSAAETTTSTSYSDLATVGPSVTLTTGTQALVGLYCSSQNSSTSLSLMGYTVSVSSSIAGADSRALGGPSGSTGWRLSAWFLETSLTPGPNTFRATYRVSGGTGTFQDRRIVVIPLS